MASSLRVSMNSWGEDGKAQAEYEDLLVSSPISPLVLSSSSPLPQGCPTPPLFPELDEYGRLGCSFEDDHTPFDEDDDLVDDDEQTIMLASQAQASPAATSDLNNSVDADGESEEDVPLGVLLAAKRESPKATAKSSKAQRRLKLPKDSPRLRVASKEAKVKPPAARGNRISQSPRVAVASRRVVRSSTPSPSPSPSLRSPSPAPSDGSSYSASMSTRPRRLTMRKTTTRSSTDSTSKPGSSSKKRLRVYKPRTGPARQDQNKAAQKKYRDKVKDAAKATFRYAQIIRRAVDSGRGRCRECPVCQKVRSATAALLEELDYIDPRQAEQLKSDVVV